MKVQHASVTFKENLKCVIFRDEFKSVTFRDDLKSVTFKNDLSKTSKENTLLLGSLFFIFSLPLSFLDTFSLFFLELMALAVVALVSTLFFGAAADTLEVSVAAVGTGPGTEASLLMLPLLLSPWWCSCIVARPLHFCCQKS